MGTLLLANLERFAMGTMIYPRRDLRRTLNQYWAEGMYGIVSLPRKIRSLKHLSCSPVPSGPVLESIPDRRASRLTYITEAVYL